MNIQGISIQVILFPFLKTKRSGGQKAHFIILFAHL